MGLLKSLTKDVTPERKAQDDALLVHAMMSVIYADGVMDEAEHATLNAFAATLPDFKERSFSEAYADAQRVVSQYPNLKESLTALKELSSEPLKKKCFILAVDIALASGDVDKHEDEMLEALQRILEIDDIFAKQTINLLAVKYAH